MARLKLGGKTIPLPANKLLRIGLGILLCIGGIFGAVLPLLGVWMFPLGVAVLAVDIPIVRRWSRRASVAITRWWRGSPSALPFRRFWGWLKGIWQRIRRRSAEPSGQ